MNNGSRLQHVYWETDTTGLILLTRDWTQETRLPPLQILPNGMDFQKMIQQDPLVYARLSGYYRKKDNIVFHIHKADYPEVSFDEAGIWVTGDFNQWKWGDNKPEWQLQPLKSETASENSEDVLELTVPLIDLIQTDPRQFKFITGYGQWLKVPETAPNVISSKFNTHNFELSFERTGNHVFLFHLPQGYLPVGNESIGWIQGGKILDAIELPPTKAFLESSTSLPLGARIENGKTIFRVFSPRASKVIVDYSKVPDSEKILSLELKYLAEDRVWKGEVGEDLSGQFYWLRVEGENHDASTHFQNDFRILDPFARAVYDARGPAIILPESAFPKVNPLYHPPYMEDLIILEAHVRDLVRHTPHAGDKAEETGFRELSSLIKDQHSYLRTLGINALELQPVQEFDVAERGQYHWGYMPVNFFSPESTFGSHPAKASQVEEFRDLISTCHQHGMAVILDVVYNHIGEPNNLLFLDKYYSFEVDQHYNLMNWSGCGNDLRTDAPVMRRLVLESLIHLVETYDVDGFRFDLADLVGVGTLEAVEKELRKIKPGIILIAEPWSFRGSIREELKGTTYASWNDEYREFLADYVHGNGNRDAIIHFLKGSPGFGVHPWQTINYTQSHDDLAWIDRITSNPDHNGFHPTQIDRRRTHLMLAITLMSPGIPMLAQGQDFLHSKQGVSNTYLRGDLNALDYQRQHYYSNTHAFARRLIELRRSGLGKVLRLGETPTDGYFQAYYMEGSSAVAILYNADRAKGQDAILIAVNPHTEPASISLWPDAEMELVQIADHERVEVDGLDCALLPITGELLTLPALSLGIWKKRPREDVME